MSRAMTGAGGKNHTAAQARDEEAIRAVEAANDAA